MPDTRFVYKRHISDARIKNLKEKKYKVEDHWGPEIPKGFANYNLQLHVTATCQFLLKHCVVR